MAYGLAQAAVLDTDRAHQELAGCCLQAACGTVPTTAFVLDRGRIESRAMGPDGWFEAAYRLADLASLFIARCRMLTLKNAAR